MTKKTSKTFSIHKPFEILLGLRDGELTHVTQLTTSESAHKTVRAACYLDASGVLVFNLDTGELRPNAEFFKTLNSLNLSLHQLRDLTRSSLVANPVFGATKESSPHGGHDFPEVFVLMPFTDALQPIYDDHIRPTIETRGYSCGRADDLFTADSIVDDVWEAINHAKVVVADCTGRNPNVFYELGIAHTLGRPAVLLAQSIDDIPFDLRHRRTIVYEYTPRGAKELEQSLSQTVDGEMLRRNRHERTTSDWKRWL